MTILCGTDFSTPASQAVTAAAFLAKRAKEPLHLVHVFDDLATVTINVEDAKGPLLGSLHDAAGRVREIGVEVEEELAFGRVADVLASMTGENEARLAVISSLGVRAPARWLLGSVADRLARLTRAPIMIVRDAAPFERWLRGERPLEVMVAADRSESSDAAVAWLKELFAFGPCHVTVAAIASPIDDVERVGVKATFDFDKVDPEVERSMLRDMHAKVGGLLGDLDPRYVVKQAAGGVDHTLVTLASELGVDLLVVGTHQRSLLGRILHGSVSRGVAHLAPMSVLAVPTPRVPHEHRAPDFQRVLAATDFSEAGDRALALAVGLLPNGGRIHLVHVLAPAMGQTPVGDLLPTTRGTAEERARVRAEIRERLRRVAEAGTAHRDVKVEVDVLEGVTADEICHAAERLSVDAVCLGQYDRSGLVSPSIARAVLRQCRRPVMIAGHEG
jgi:nucleotide-binding universal stress UspA family protein